MKKHTKFFLLYSAILLLILGVLVSIPAFKDTTDDHNKQETTEENNILEIHNLEEFMAFSDSLTKNDYQDWEVKLCSDLDFSKYTEMVPLGYVGGEKKSVPFRGTFNGNGYKITGLTITMEDTSAGLFAKLCGTVKNLHMENCSFSGYRSGPIAADMQGGYILNCYVDATVEEEKTGAIAMVLDGIIENCVASSDAFYGLIREGEVRHCFTINEYNDEELNGYLMHLKSLYHDSDWNCWEKKEQALCLTNKNAQFPETLTAKAYVGGRDLQFDGYYSLENRKWTVALPAGFSNKEVRLEIRTTDGQTVQMKKRPEEQELCFTQEGLIFPIEFLCAENIDTMYITLAKQKDLSYVHENKYEEIPGILTLINQDGTSSYASIQGFYGHGNDSWLADKKSYNLKFDTYVDLLGLGANQDFALLAGHRRDSLMSYVVSNELAKEIGFDYSQDFRLVNLYVAGEYAGVYFLAEKMKLDTNRIEIGNVFENTRAVNARQLESYEFQEQYDEERSIEQYYYDVSSNPADITGGYLLEIDVEDYGETDSRFVTKRNIGVVLKRARYSSKEQVEYISEYWQDFENALFSQDGNNDLGRHYTEYIDLESFAMQWLMYELQQEISLNSSIYYYKESDVDGDGLIHACQPWDVESSYIFNEVGTDLWMTGAKEKTLSGYWKAFYQHEDFRKAVSEVWQQKFVPALEFMLSSEPQITETGARNLNWHRLIIEDIHKLESSRWQYSYPWKRLEEIEAFLMIRSTALGEIFSVNN